MPDGSVPFLRTVRYVRSWKVGARAVESEQVAIRREGMAVPATLVRPANARGRLRAWIAIGGVSRRGRFHPQLTRFTEALASTGVAVLVPGLPEWRRLSVSPRVTLPTIRASVEFLRRRDDIVPERLGVIGFSFGAAGVAIAASHRDLAEHIAGAVLFGGYCCLDRTLACMLTGEHEWEEDAHRLSPDPYGRWVVACNYLTRVPGYEDHEDVASSVRRLAASASDRRISAWDSFHDEMIAELRHKIPARRREAFDMLASPTGGRRPPRDDCARFARALADTCRTLEPQLDPVSSIHRVLVPTQIIHGRGDRLIPFTEAMRMQRSLPATVRRGVTVTRMFGHSADTVPPTRAAHAIEAARLFQALHRLVCTV